MKGAIFKFFLDSSANIENGVDDIGVIVWFVFETGNNGLGLFVTVMLD